MLRTLAPVTSDSFLVGGEALVCDRMGVAEMVLVEMPGILAARVTLCPNDITAPFEGQGAEFPPFRAGIQKKTEAGVKMLGLLTLGPGSLATRLYVFEELTFVVLLIVILFGTVTLVVASALVVQEAGHRLAQWARTHGFRVFKRDLEQPGVRAPIAHAHLRR